MQKQEYFLKKDYIEKSIKNLYEYLRTGTYGQKYKWEKLMEMSGLDKKNESMDLLYYIVNKVCLLLMQYDAMYLETIHGYGKRIVEPYEHTIVAKKKVKKSVKIYKNAGAILAATNLDLLTNEQKNEVINSANKYSTLKMFAEEMLKRKKIGIKEHDDNEKASLFLDTIKFFTSTN